MLLGLYRQHLGPFGLLCTGMLLLDIRIADHLGAGVLPHFIKADRSHEALRHRPGMRNLISCELVDVSHVAVGRWLIIQSIMPGSASEE